MDASETGTAPGDVKDAVPCRGAVHEVRLFGAFSVRSPEGAVLTPPGRKARALLAHVLLSAGREVSREQLAALLWSQRGEDQARASLRQTLYELRALSVGERPLVRHDRTHVRLAGDSIRTDLDRLRDAAHVADARSLADQVGDQPLPLLRDLDGIDPALDEWLSVERSQRHDERRQIMLNVGLASHATRTGTEGAQRLAAALLAADPFDEAAARLAMSASHGLGDRDGVRVAYTRLQTALRQGLRTSPSPETQRLHDHLMAAPVKTPETAQTPLAARDPPPPPQSDVQTAAPADAAPAPDPRPPGRRWHWSVRPVAAALSLLLCVAAWQGLRPSGGTAKRVLRVEALKVAATDSPAQALRIGLAAELSRLIVGNDMVLVVADADERSADAADDAGIVLTGEAQSSGGLLHANLRLIARRGGAILWSNSFTRSENEIEPLRQQMAAKLADVTLCAIGGGRNPTFEALGADTMRLYLGACEQKHGDWALSAKLLRQVVARQPGFAHGWAMLAAATAVSAVQFPDASGAALQREAEEAARHALSLDDTDGEAYFAQAMAMPGLHNWFARQAVLEAGHAVEPANAQLDSALSENLAQVGRCQEAIVYGQHALEFDAFSPSKAASLARLLAFGGDVLEARVLLREQRRLFPQDESVARTELVVEAFLGDARHAMQLLGEAKGRVEMTAAREAMWRTQLAVRQEPSAAHVEEAVAAVLADAREPNQSKLGTVVRLAALGRVEQAYDIAQSLPTAVVDSGDPSLLFWTIAAPLRADPRFMPLAARHGLAALWLKTDRWPDFCNDHSVAYDCRIEALKAVGTLGKVQ